MRFHEEFLTILDVRQNQNNLILRLDIGDEFRVEEYEQTIIEVELVDCKNIKLAYEEIQKYIGDLIWNYEYLEEEQGFKILMESSDEILIYCTQIIEKKDDIRTEELFLKFKWLAKNYKLESESSSKGWGKYQKLRDLLKVEIKNDLSNWEKRKSFFEQNKTEQIEKAETVIKFCQKILNFIEQVEKEEQ